MIDLTRLNPMQRQAVEYGKGPLLVLAGAGSGKTRVLTYRIAKLIEEGTPAWSILAITFTNKAAKEMRERVLSLCGESAEEAWISTFHSCCVKILRRDIEKIGYKRSFAIYDEDDSMTVVKNAMKMVDLNDKETTPRYVKAILSDRKNKLMSPEEWLRGARSISTVHRIVTGITNAISAPMFSAPATIIARNAIWDRLSPMKDILRSTSGTPSSDALSAIITPATSAYCTNGSDRYMESISIGLIRFLLPSAG